MRMVWLAVIVGFIGSLKLAAGETPAARPSEPDRGNDKFTFGTVVAVRGGEVVLKEYDFTKDADVEVGYAVVAETEFGNVKGVAELKAGDEVVLDYVEVNGKRVIAVLVKELVGESAPKGETALGVVVSLAPGKLTIRQAGAGKQESVLVAYAVARRAELQGLKSLSGLRAGDKVQCEYVVSSGRRLIVKLVRE